MYFSNVGVDYAQWLDRLRLSSISSRRCSSRRINSSEIDRHREWQTRICHIHGEDNDKAAATFDLRWQEHGCSGWIGSLDRTTMVSHLATFDCLAHLFESLWLFASIRPGNSSDANRRRISFSYSSPSNLCFHCCHRTSLTLSCTWKITSLADLLSSQGQLDKATLELIRRPRCGLADHEPNRVPRPHIYGNRRRRRYVLQGQKWAKTYLTYKWVRSSFSLFSPIDQRSEKSDSCERTEKRSDQWLWFCSLKGTVRWLIFESALEFLQTNLVLFQPIPLIEKVLVWSDTRSVLNNERYATLNVDRCQMTFDKGMSGNETASGLRGKNFSLSCFQFEDDPVIIVVE